MGFSGRAGYSNLVGNGESRMERRRSWEFRLQAVLDRVNAELPTDKTSRATVGR